MNPITIVLILLNIIFLIGMLLSFRQWRLTTQELTTKKTALHDSEEKLRALVDESSEGLVLADENGIVIEWNRSLERITGIGRNNAIGKYLWEIQSLLILPERNSAELVENTKELFHNILQTGASPILNKNIEIEIQQPSGKRITIEQINFTIKSENGYLIGSILRDVSSRRQAENISKESLLRLNALLNNIPDIAWIKDTESKFVAVNKPLADIYQTTIEAIIGKTDYDLCPAELAQGYQLDDQDVMRSKKQKRIEEQLIDFEGNKYWLETIKTPIFNLQGEVVGTAGLSRDITERKRTEKIQLVLYRISESAHTALDMNDLYRTIHNNIQDLMPAKNLYIAFYDAREDSFYFPYHVDEKDEEWPPIKPGKGLTQFVYSTGKPLLATPDIFQQLLDSGEIELIGEKPVDWLGVPLRTQHNIIGVMAVQTYHRNERLTETDKDVLVFISTQVAMVIERRQIEEELRNSQANLAEAQRMAHIGSWDWNLITNEVDWSDEFFRITGWNPNGKQLYETLSQLIHPDDRDLVQAAIDKAIHDFQPYSLDHRIIRSDGTELYMHSQAEVVFDNAEQPVRIIGTVQDITEIRLAEAQRNQLIQELQAKNTELDRFTYTVSHDLRAPLVTIRGFMGFLEKDIWSGNSDQLKADMARITAAINKLQRFLDELLQLSRAGRVINPLEPVGFQVIIYEALEMLRGRIDEQGVRVSISESLPIILCDRVRFTQVVQNLVENAVKFMGEQTDPLIEIGMQGIDSSGNAILFVRDNGIGIEQQYQEKIFELFNKLDAHSEGTGIGLTIVRRIIEAHHGKVWLYSDGAGTGTTFYFTCPISRNVEDNGSGLR